MRRHVLSSQRVSRHALSLSRATMVLVEVRRSGALVQTTKPACYRNNQDLGLAGLYRPTERGQGDKLQFSEYM